MRRLVPAVFLAAILAASAIEVSLFPDPLNNNYSPLLRLPPEARPSLALTAARGEAVHAAVMLFNPGPQTAYVRVQADGFPASSLTLREAAHIRASFGQLLADVLPALSPDGVVVIPATENRQLFLDIDTRAMPAGTHAGVIRCTDTASRQSVECQLAVRVSGALALPSRHPLSVIVWDCSLYGTTGELAKNILAELTGSYVNTFHVLERAPARFNAEGDMVQPPDFSALDARLDLLQGKGLLMLRCSAPSLQILPEGKLDITTEAGAKAYGQWTKALVDHLKQRNLSYDDFYFYIYDENLRDDFYAAARAAKAADPNVRVYADPCGSTKIEEITRALEARCVDYLQYHAGWFQNMPAELEKTSRDQAAVLSTYWCPVHHKRLSPSAFYRRMGAFAFMRNLTGVGFWAALGLAGDTWGVPLDDFRKSASPVAIYPAGDTTVMPSRRWKGFRAGLDDFLFFQALDGQPDSPRRTELLNQARNAAENRLTAAEAARLRLDIIALLEGK